MTAITFSRQNDEGSRTSTTYTKKISYSWSSPSQNLKLSVENAWYRFLSLETELRMTSYDVKLSQPRPQGFSLGMRLKHWNSVFTRLRFRERVHFPLSKSFLKFLLGSKFGSFPWKISGSNGTSNKLVLFFRTQCSKRKFVFTFFRAIFDSTFRFTWLFFGAYQW